MILKIRKATNNDINTIIKLIDKHYQKYGDKINLDNYDKDLKDIEKSYFKNNGFFWVAECQQKICGSIAALPKSKEILELKRFYVDEQFQRKGIGEKLFLIFLNFAQQNKFKTIILESDTRYFKSHNFYKKQNFVISEKIDKDDADLPYSVFIFQKKLFYE